MIETNQQFGAEGGNLTRKRIHKKKMEVVLRKMKKWMKIMNMWIGLLLIKKTLCKAV